MNKYATVRGTTITFCIFMQKKRHGKAGGFPQIDRMKSHADSMALQKRLSVAAVTLNRFFGRLNTYCIFS